DPHGAAAGWNGTDADLAAPLVAARRRLPAVRLPDAELTRIASVCTAFGVDGMRADIVVARTAVALAAWHAQDRVTEAEVRDAARLALPHRRRRDPFDAPGLDEQALDRALDDAREPDGGPDGPHDRPDGPDDGPDDHDPDRGPGGGPDPAGAEAPDATDTAN